MINKIPKIGIGVANPKAIPALVQIHKPEAHNKAYQPNKIIPEILSFLHE